MNRRMQQGQQQQTRIAQRQVLGLAARQVLDVLALPLPELADFLDRKAGENPFLASLPPAVPPRRAAPEPESGGPSFYGHVVAAIPLLVGPAADRPIAMRLAEALDETGLVVEDLHGVAAELGLPVARVESVLARLQTIEPTGLFARSVKECLALQLRACGLLDETAVTLLCHLDDLHRVGADGFARRHGLDAGRLRSLLATVSRLSRAPGAAFGARVAPAIWPDLTFRRSETGWTATLCADVVPRVALRPAAYARALAQAPDAASRSLARRQWHEAQALRRMLALRDDTLLRLGAILAQDQRRGLDSGLRILDPLTQREVAARLSVHDSTISRLVSHRIALVEGQAVALKRFFERPRAVQGPTRSAVLSALRQRVADEPKAAPFSDEALARLLSQAGMQVSRRRVAKYRDLLHIPAAHRRRGTAPPDPGG